MYVITEEHEIKYCYFTLEKVTRVHLEGGSYHIFMDIYNYFVFFIFRLNTIWFEIRDSRFTIQNSRFKLKRMKMHFKKKNRILENQSMCPQ